MERSQSKFRADSRGFSSCVLLCLAFTFSSPLYAVSPAQSDRSIIARDTLGAAAGGGNAAAPFSVLPDPGDAGLDFDLAGSETRKLQLQLNHPLTLTTTSAARVLDNGSDVLGLDATLAVPLSDNFSLSASAEKQVGNARFQSLGSIQCLNGTLRADSYTASGCRFVNEPIAGTESNRIDLGTQFDIGKASASVNWFTQDASATSSPNQNYTSPALNSALGGSLLSPNLGNPLLVGSGTDPLQYLNNEASGVDLNFKVGFTTDNRGDLQLGLAFTHVYEAEYQGLYANGVDALAWTVAEPFNTAQMNLEWNKGSFSSGIQAYYRDPVNFLNRKNLDSMTTFDVHFTWRTPWKANLSVGASNVLNAGADTQTKTDSQPIDPLESVYGRIPYVRYKQDL